LERGDGPASVDMVDEGWFKGFLVVLVFVVVTGRYISHEEVS
jgi:hypothetical protein